MDISASSKGEGLRPFLAKDPVAESYLNHYQERSLSHHRNAIIGTLGVGLLIGSYIALRNKKVPPPEGRALALGGVSLLVLNVLVAQSIEFGNEKLLRKSIDEYNKRNRPKIYFLPERQRRSFSEGSRVGVEGRI